MNHPKNVELGLSSDVSASITTALTRWLVGLRWVMIGLLCAVWVASATLLDLHVTWFVALPTMVLLVAANLALLRAGSAGTGATRVVAASVSFDIVAIAVFLGASGGAANPFSAVLFVYVALAASLLPPRTAYLVTFLSAGVFGALFLVPDGQNKGCEMCAQTHGSMGGGGGSFSNHLYGMWAAFALGAVLIATLLTRMRRALEARDAELSLLRQRSEESQKFAALGTLAAGAAHELATPLGTISILAGELSSEQGKPILAEVERCKNVLFRMQPGVRRPEKCGDAILGAAVESAVEHFLAANPSAQIKIARTEDVTVPIATDDIEAALSVLLDNAHHATIEARSSEPIVVEAGVESEGAFVRVSDAGTGISETIAGRLGEPFLTTKEPGAGMGLGLYLVRTLLGRLGGRLEFAANSPRGTSVSLHFLRTEALTEGGPA